jgi:hypothetical protein
MTGQMSGSIRVTDDKALGGSGKACRVYSASWLSDGTARDLVLRNGTSASGDIYIQKKGAISDTVVVSWENGLRFPAGCFIDFTASTVSVVLEYRIED